MFFDFNLQTRVYFGVNSLAQAIQEERELLSKNVLVITTGGSLFKYGYIDKVTNSICSLGANIVVYDKISPNPQLSQVLEAIDIAKKNDAHVIVGFGGGSAIDAAKAVAVGACCSCNDMHKYLINGELCTSSSLPIIAIPTTAGTGTELSKAAIISCDEHKIKGGIRGDSLLPTVAVVDPVFTLTVPKKTTFETAFDVFAHAAESYVAVKANAFSTFLSEKAIRTVGEHLPVLMREPENIKSREQMSFASMLMGLNLGNVGTGLPHRMQYPIAAHTNTSHPAGLMALYPTWIKYQFEINPQKVKDIFSWLGLSNVSSGFVAKDLMLNFVNSSGSNYTLENLGIKKERVDNLHNEVTGNIQNDPLAKNENIIKLIYGEAF